MNKTSAEPFDQEAFIKKYKEWLANGGTEELAAAMKRAAEASRRFAESTAARWETLYEPVDFYDPDRPRTGPSPVVRDRFVIGS